jgi:hypothetical protein
MNPNILCMMDGYAHTVQWGSPTAPKHRLRQTLALFQISLAILAFTDNKKQLD